MIPKAIVFDVFGTIVDWRGSIIAEGAAWTKATGLHLDWDRFADRWRAAYKPSMDQVRTGRLPWTRLDDLHRASLDQLIVEFALDWTTADKDHWNHVWHRLQPWADCVAGLTRLKQKFIIAPLSNGNIALMTNLARHSGLPWDAILGAELVHHYKPDPEVYLSAPYFLDLKPEEVMMAAAHSGDLQAARACGLQTAFLYRPDEYGLTRTADQAQPGEFDIVAADTLDLARQLGA